MSFPKKDLQNETNSGGLINTITGYLPMLTLLLEQFTGQSIPQAKGTLADILTCLQRLETKLDNLERNCSEQFIHQESQLNSLQQVNKLVNTETKEIHFANANNSLTTIEE